MGKKTINNGHLTSKERKRVKAQLPLVLEDLAELAEDGFLCYVGDRRSLQEPSVWFIQGNHALYLALSPEGQVNLVSGDDSMSQSLAEMFDAQRLKCVEYGNGTPRLLEAKLSEAVYRSRGHNEQYPI